MTYDALALSCRMMTCLWCHRHVMEDLFRPMQYLFPQLPSCLWTAAHLLVCERKNGNPKNVTFIPYWFCNTSVGWAVDETPLWRHREHVAVRPVADHGWWVAGAEAVLTSACATLSRDAASGGITDMFFFPLLQNISSFSLWAYRFTIILYEHMLIITRKGPSYLLHSRPLSVFTMMWLGNPKEESHLRALCVGVERPPSSTGPVLCHPCPRMTSARLCGTSIMWAAVSLNENMDLRSFSYCDIFFSLWLNSWFFTKTWSIVLFRINKYVLFIVLKRNDFLFRIMIARRKVWRWPLSFHLFSGSSNVNIGIHGGRKRPSCSSLLTWCSFWWYCDWVFKRNLCSVWRDELV